MPRMDQMVRFQVLGPLRLLTAAGEVFLVGSREGVVLSMLLLHANDAVPVARLIEAVWGERPPATARNQIQKCASDLRRRLAAAGQPGQAIYTGPGGYRLSIDQAGVDLFEFRRLLAEARTAATAGPSAAARDRYRAALGLWRAAAFADVESVAVRQAAAVLEEEKERALEECVELELALGDTRDLVSQLTRLVQQHPYRERLQASLMLALYRSGRQAEALATYQRFRKLLRDDLAIEPGPELRRLNKAILNQDSSLGAGRPARAPVPAPAAPVPRELLADVGGFTGRDGALAALDRTLPDVLAHEPVVISAVAGTAGVGKTALAIHWAHRVANRFPEGQLFIDLRGYAVGPPLRPIDALASLLRSLGVPPEQIPIAEAQAGARYRTLLADRRMLIVLDNAGSVEQVRPLLPGSPGCLVLITSRDRLSGLVARDGARRLTLDVLTPTEARTLLTRLLGSRRVQAEAGAVGHLASACAYLPLALRIAAATLSDQPDRSIRSYVAQLTDSGDWVTGLRVDDDDDSSVLSAFNLSYRALPAGAARLFRLLGLVPGPDFTPATVAALTATNVEEATGNLRKLANVHLVTEHTPGRYTFHDLLRGYARRLARAEGARAETGSAVARLLGYYVQAADAATSLLYPQMLRLPAPSTPVHPVPVVFERPAQASAWLNSERENLVAAVRHASVEGPRNLAWLLADHLRRYFWHSRHAIDWREAATAALAATSHDGDHQAMAAVHLSLADQCQSVGRYDEAIEHYAVAATHAEQAGWTDGRGSALLNLGMVHHAQGRPSDAAESHGRALALYQRTGHAAGQARGHNNLGIVARELGRPREAAFHHDQALRLYQQLNSVTGEATARLNLGIAHHHLGRLDSARQDLQHALRVAEDIGDRPCEASALERLAAVERDAGDLSNAQRRALAGVAMGREMGETYTYAEAINTLASVYISLREPEQARTCYQQALDLADRADLRASRTTSLLGLAEAVMSTDRELAGTYLRQALDLSRGSGWRLLEGRALTLQAQLHLSQGSPGTAVECAEAALDIHRGAEYRLGEARTLAILTRIRYATGDLEAARHSGQEAVRLFTDVGSPVPDDLPAIGKA